MVMAFIFFQAYQQDDKLKICEMVCVVVCVDMRYLFEKFLIRIRVVKI